jgi:hypothetical protein
MRVDMMPRPAITAFLLANATHLPHHLPARAVTGGEHRRATTTRLGGGEKIQPRRLVMRRVTALCAATAFVVSNLVVAGVALARPMPQQSGYYVIRWDNTGVCQIWNTDLQQQPLHFFSDYKVVSKPVPTFAAANAIQEQMRVTRRCTL